MLIVPIVEGLNWRRPPPVTIALILLNCAVFFLYQTGDTAREARALEAYMGSTLRGFMPADPRPATWITSMFLHGDLMHLVGNMVFLFIVGVAVESALGGVWYVLLYLAGGLAGDALHYVVHPMSTIPTVGASGAISGLMGLFTVVFGLRLVNFFYWVLVFFGFKAMRGIVVLPIWIGWEILQYLTDRRSSIAYMERAGRLIGGAILGFVVLKRFAGARVEQFHGEREQEAFDNAEYGRARALVAKLDFKSASAVFARLAQRFPTEARLLREWHAIAKTDPASGAYHDVAGKILALQKSDTAQRASRSRCSTSTSRRRGPRRASISGACSPPWGSRSRARAISPRRSRPPRSSSSRHRGGPRLAILWEALAYALGKAGGDEASLKKAKRYRALIGAQARARVASGASGCCGNFFARCWKIFCAIA